MTSRVDDKFTGFDFASGQGVALCIPTYNEATTLPEIIARVRRALPKALILVVDDDSPDKTGDIAEDLAKTDHLLGVIHNRHKGGLGGAYRVGFSQILGSHPEVLVVVSMDADGSHDPADLPRLLIELSKSDIALGSRWVPGGQVTNWPKWREVLSRGGNTYARAMLGLDLGDATGGFRAYRREVLENIDFASTTSQGYCFQVEMVGRALEQGMNVTEVPITFTERIGGVSKMSNAIVAEAFARIGLWGARRALNKPPFGHYPGR